MNPRQSRSQPDWSGPASHAKAAFDWDAAKRRLAKVAEALDSSTELSSRRAREIMDQRAAEFARIPQAVESGDRLELLLFRLGDDRFALETRFVREVTLPNYLTGLPGAPDFAAGVTNLRGELLTVFDLREVLGAERRDVEQPELIVLGGSRSEFGLLADAVEEVSHMNREQLVPPPRSLPARTRGYVDSVTADGLALLNGQALLTDSRLYVDES